MPSFCQKTVTSGTPASESGAWRQPWLPRWSVQLAAVVLAAMLSPLLVQLLTFGGDFIAFIGSRPHVRGYILVSIGAGVLGVLFALGGLYRERDAQIQAQALQFAPEKETLEPPAADARRSGRRSIHRCRACRTPRCP